jgi:hypothetical protein
MATVKSDAFEDDEAARAAAEEADNREDSEPRGDDRHPDLTHVSSPAARRDADAAEEQ